MNNDIKAKRVSVGLFIILVICFVYILNSKNQTVLITSAILLALWVGLDTIQTIKRKKYKTVYLIAFTNVINLISIIFSIVLSLESNNAMDIEQMINHIRLQNISKLCFLLSLLASNILKSEVFKLNKDLAGHESRDV